jgi:hypothetical protein
VKDRSWTLEPIPSAESQSIFRTETRVTTTDHDGPHEIPVVLGAFSPGIFPDSAESCSDC